jgi:hypothetical protein
LRPHHLTALALAAVALAALAACGDEPVPEMTTTGAQVAGAVVRQLEYHSGGELYEVDCGDDDDILVSSGREVACTVVDPDTGVELDVTATLEVIGQGAGWRARVEMPEELATASPTGSESGSD